MSSTLTSFPTTIGAATTDVQQLGSLTGAVGQDWYTAHNVFNPGGAQYAQLQGAGGNVFGATVQQSQLAPAVNSGLFATTGFGGLSPLFLLIIIFVFILIGYVVVKNI